MPSGRRTALQWAALVLLLLVLPLAAFAQDLVAVPPLKARVTDLTGTLSPEQMGSLEQQLAQFEKARGSQIAILLVPTTQPEAIEQYSIRVAEAWRIGRRNHDDGVLVVVAKNDRKLRIDVGYGLEGAIPDALAKRIIAEVITPRFKAGDFHGGLSAGVARIQALIAGEQLPAPPAAPDDRGAQGIGDQIETLLVIALVVATVFGGILSAVLGRLLGGLATGGVVGFIAMLITGSLFAAAVAAVLVFFFVLVFAGRGGNYGGTRGGGWGGGTGGGSWGGSSGGGWSGGGGSFGGGGASGDW